MANKITPCLQINGSKIFARPLPIDYYDNVFKPLAVGALYKCLHIRGGGAVRLALATFGTSGRLHRCPSGSPGALLRWGQNVLFILVINCAMLWSFFCSVGSACSDSLLRGAAVLRAPFGFGLAGFRWAEVAGCCPWAHWRKSYL